MCGRFVSASPPEDIAKYFSAGVASESIDEPNWNVAPTDDVVVVRHDGITRRLATHRWGLVPFWAKDLKVGGRMINARAETLATNGAFKHAFSRRRCLVPADGFYEWTTVPGQKAKQPYFIHRPDGEPFAFAGLWEEWRGGSDEDRRGCESLRSVTIVTTGANKLMATIHDRMPVILAPDDWDDWLDPEHHDVASLRPLLVPAPPNLVMMHPVGTAVNSVRNNGAELVDPIIVGQDEIEFNPPPAAGV